MDDEAGLSEAAHLFKVLGSDSRLRLLLAIDREPQTVGALVERTGLSQPLVSQHLRTLRQAALVTVRRQGREAVYAVADRHITHVIEDAVAHVLEGPASGGDPNPTPRETS